MSKGDDAPSSRLRIRLNRAACSGRMPDVRPVRKNGSRPACRKRWMAKDCNLCSYTRQARSPWSKDCDDSVAAHHRFVAARSISRQPQQGSATLGEGNRSGCCVPLVWLVDPRQRTVNVIEGARPPRVLGEKDALDGGTVIPDLRCKVGEFFEGLAKEPG